MNRRRCGMVAIGLMAVGCSRGPSADSASKTAPPAKVEHPRTEAELSTVMLSADAVRRLGVESAPATVQQVSGSRTLGGEVTAPEGRSLVVTSPVAGTLASAGVTAAGARVRKGQAVFRLTPLAAGERDQPIEAQRAVSAAEAEAQAATQRLDRLTELLKGGAASQRSVEEARAQQEVAAAALAAARQRVTSLRRNPVGARGELTIAAPFDGILQAVTAAQGQTVAASAPLFEIVQVDALWVRVPIYAGDLDHVDTAQPAMLTSLDSSGPPRTLRRVATAPLRADPRAASVDLFYEIVGPVDTLRPGQRVSVQVPLVASTKGLVAPASALLYDMHGSTWVYEDQGNGKYVRRRVDVARQIGDRILIARGIAEGTRVVSVGAAELFGTEFATGK